MLSDKSPMQNEKAWLLSDKSHLLYDLSKNSITVLNDKSQWLRDQTSSSIAVGK